MKRRNDNWQLELIVTAILLSVIFSADKYIFDKSTDIMYERYFPYTTLMGLAMIISFYLLKHSLVIHFVLRILWIAALSLYRSDQIDKANLTTSVPVSPSLLRYVRLLDYVASLIFPIMLNCIFITISLTLYVLYLSLLSDYFFLLMAFIFIGVFGFMEFLKPGFFSNAHVPDDLISKILLLTSKVLIRANSVLTLSILWEPLYRSFTKRVAKRTVGLLLVPYIIISGFLPPMSRFESNKFFPEFPDKLECNTEVYFDLIYYYDDYKEYHRSNPIAYPITTLSIPSRKLFDDFLEVFVRYTDSDDYLLEKNTNLIPVRKSGLVNIFSWRKDIISQNPKLDSMQRVINENKKGEKPTDHLEKVLKAELRKIKEDNSNKIKEALISRLEFKIDDQLIPRDSIQYGYFNHPNDGERGLLCIIDLKGYKRGDHVLGFKKENFNFHSNKIDTICLKLPLILIK